MLSPTSSRRRSGAAPAGAADLSAEAARRLTEVDRKLPEPSSLPGLSPLPPLPRSTGNPSRVLWAESAASPAVSADAGGFVAAVVGGMLVESPMAAPTASAEILAAVKAAIAAAIEDEERADAADSCVAGAVAQVLADTGDSCGAAVAPVLAAMDVEPMAYVSEVAVRCDMSHEGSPAEGGLQGGWGVDRPAKRQRLSAGGEALAPATVPGEEADGLVQATSPMHHVHATVPAGAATLGEAVGGKVFDEGGPLVEEKGGEEVGEKVLEQWTSVQCDDCGKWRQLPPEYQVKILGFGVVH